MRCLVGYRPHQDDLGALALACQIARSDGGSVHAVSVVPRGWPTAVAGDSDRDFSQWAALEGERSAAEAAERLAVHADVPSEATWVTGRSVPQALLHQAAELGADMLVVGSGGHASPGHISVTSKTDRLLHSSHVPIAIAPRGYEAPPGSTVRRVNLGFRGDDATWSLLDPVSGFARRTHAKLRVVTFAVRSRKMYPPEVSGAEDMVLDAWVEQARQEQAEAAEHLQGLGDTDEVPALEVAIGGSWAEAMAGLSWADGEVLVVGSSATHRLSQVFLGSSAAKIVRYSPVPVVVVP